MKVFILRGGRDKVEQVTGWGRSRQRREELWSSECWGRPMGRIRCEQKTESF